MFQLLQVAVPCRRTIDRHCALYVQPSIVVKYGERVGAELDKLDGMEPGLILAGDGRCDSPGHCAKYGSYTLIEQRINRVVSVKLVQVCTG